MPLSAAGDDPAAAGRPRSGTDALVRGGALNLAGAAVNGLMQVALVVVVTRTFDPSTAGLFFAATSTFLIAGAFAELGAGTGVVRFVAGHLATGRRADAVVVLRLAIGCAATAGVVVAVVLAAWADELAPLVGGRGADLAPALVVLALAVPVAATYEVVLAGTRAMGTMRPSVLVDRVGRMAAQPVGALAAAGAGAGLVGLTAAWAASYVLALPVAVVLLVRVLRRRTGGQPSTERAPLGETVRAFWRYTSLRAVARICQVALQRVDIILVAALRSPAEAAVYAAATRLVVLGQMGVQAVQLALQPQISRSAALGDVAGTREAFRHATVLTVMVTWPVYLAAIAVTPLLLRLFGEDYVGGAGALVVLATAMLFGTAMGPVDTVLLMAGRSHLSLAGTALALLVNVVVNLLLIPPLGVLGAACAWAAAIVTANTWAVFQVRRTMGMTALSRELGLLVLLTLACFGLAPLALRLVPGAPVLLQLAALALAGVAYLLLLVRYRRALGLEDVMALLRRGRRRGAAGTSAASKAAPEATPLDAAADRS